MAYLDVEPMIVALRSSADDFEMNHGWLHHFPSHHRFKIHRSGKVRLNARCDCAQLAIREQQGLQLRDAFQDWYASYWRPIEINREFASHFERPGPAGRVWRALMRRLRRFLDGYDPADEAGAVPPLIPAE